MRDYRVRRIIYEDTHVKAKSKHEALMMVMDGGLYKERHYHSIKVTRMTDSTGAP